MWPPIPYLASREVFTATRPVGAATHAANLWSTYQIQNGLARGLTFGFGLTYKGDTFADSLNLLRVPSYVVFDAAVSYRIKRMDTSRQY